MKSEEETRRRVGHGAWAFAFAVVAVVVILTAAGLYVFRSLRSLPGGAVEAGREVLGDLREVAEAFRQGSVRTVFVNHATRVSGSTYLQVATLEQTEVYTRSDHADVFWGQLQLPDVVVAATVPVEYTYYLDLDERWDFLLEGGVIHVTAPPIRNNPPAIDISNVHFDVRESSLLRDEEPVVEQLRAALTDLSRERASDHVSLIRETARRQTEKFVRTWLSGSFSDGGDYWVEVTFADEVGRLAPLDTAVD
jgi:hypothetical protein